MVVRKTEDNTDIPTEWTQYRSQVRLTCQVAISGMNATTDIEHFVAFVTTVQWPASPDVPNVGA